MLSRPILLPSWRAVRSYWPHLEERDSIWGNDCSHSPFIRWSPSWGFPQLKTNARRSVHTPGFNFIITLIISDRRDWRDTRGNWPLTKNPNRSWWHRYISLKIFWPQPMTLWRAGFVLFRLVFSLTLFHLPCGFQIIPLSQTNFVSLLCDPSRTV